MKLQKTTIILIILTLGLGTFIYLTQIQGSTIEEVVKNEEKNPQKTVFSFTKEDIKKLEIELEKTTLEFEKSKQTILPWEMIKPEKVKANDASLSFLINLFIDSKINQSFNVTEDQLKDYGLDNPQAKIYIELENQEKHQLNLGKSNFDDTLIYAQIDGHKQEDNNKEIVLISKSFQYAVDRELNDWKQLEDSPSQ